MQIQVTQQEEVRHHGPVNRKKYRGCPWESRKVNQQAAKDEGQKGFQWPSMGTPHPSTDTGSGNDCRTTCRAKDWRRDDDRAPKSTHSETVKKDQKVHLYERPMIVGTSPQPGKSHKRRNTRNSHRLERSNYRAHLTYQEGANRNRRRTQDKNHHKQAEMVRMKKTHSKRGPQGKEPPTSARRITRMEQAAREAKGTFLTQVDPKGKAIINRWEREINTTRKGKAWTELIQEADGIRDPGATQPRTTLYHKTVEEAWRTKMLIGKMNADRKETSREAIRDHKKVLTEILSHLSNLEASAKRLAEDQRSQKEKMERMAGQFHLYLRYVHHMEITPADRSGTPACIRKMRTVEQRKENEARKDGDARHPIILD
jgi:hypothetical protein